MNELPVLTLEVLAAAVAGGAVAIRSVSRLQPAGGPGDKVFPPTYAQDANKLKYAMETRRMDGAEVPTVLLDSVASQANRMEEALQRAWDEERLSFPVVSVDFSGLAGLEDLDRITSLQAPHRLADALLRDSVDEAGTPFRDTAVGRAFTDANPKSATAVWASCPTALIFGVWDSTGPKGGLGSKFQRALVSEIVGVGAKEGVKTASRMDPAGIQASVEVYHRKDDHDEWTINPDEAEKKGGKPTPFSRKGSEGKGKPSAINHSNVAPSIDNLAGGVTFDYAQQTTVLSLPALRRLRFPDNTRGERPVGAARLEGENAARTALAALALAAVAELREQGFDLRSRANLAPEGPAVLELLHADGGPPARFRLDARSAAALVSAASARAQEAGFEWSREPLRLRPAPKLAALIRKSRELAGTHDDGDDK